MATERQLTARFSVLDLTVAVLFLGSLLFFSSGLIRLDGTRRDWLLGVFGSPEAVNLAVNLTLSTFFFILALVAAWPTLRRNTALYREKPSFALGMIPLGVIAMLIGTAALVLLSGTGAQGSVNQGGLESMMRALPPAAVVPLVVVTGPFVEEFVFRQLLIGKLSRYLNVWLCAVISVLAFAVMHVAGKEPISFAAMAPYLGMGVVLALAYVLCGRNLLLVYSLHLTKNLLALLVFYSMV